MLISTELLKLAEAIKSLDTATKLNGAIKVAFAAKALSRVRR